MATDVDQSCYGWSREELDDQDDSRDISVSQMLDHGSISFGRFALEPLSWEKRSVFTHNRYQEELEKFKAPGLVAQKKAYFEEYYKRIRAMKALQDNKPTESASNCGIRSGISEQIREDQRVIPSKSDVDEMISIIGSGVQKASADLTLDVDCETDLVKPDSHATFLIDNKNGEKPPNSKHSQNLDRNSFHDEPITSIMHIEQEFIRVDNKLEPRRIISKSISRLMGVQNQRIIGKKSNGDELEYIVVSDVENASIEVPIGIDVTALLGSNPPVEHSDEKKMGKNSQNSKQSQLLDQNSCEDCKQHDFICEDNEAVSKKTEKYVSNDSCYSLSSPKVLEGKLVPKQKKVKEAVQGVKGSAFSSEVMEHSSTAGDLVKSEIKTTSVTVMLTQVLRDSSQKKNGKNNIPIVPNKHTVDRILTSKHATIVSHASNKEMHSKATTPRPFAFATRKQAVASVSASARCDNKKILSSSSLPPKNVNSKGVSSSSGMQYIQKREKLENRRGQEPRRQPIVTIRQANYIKGASVSNVIRPLKARGQEPGRQPIATSRQATYVKGASLSNVIRPLKARSVNLPTSCKGDSNAGSNSNRITRNSEDGKRRLIEVANDETCLKEVRSHGKSTIFHVLSRNQNPDIRKMAPSRIRDLSVNAKNSQLRDNAMGRGNSRPEKPRWR